MDLGTEPSKTPGVIEPAKGPSYPGLSLSDDKAKEFLEECPDLKIGDEVTAKVKLKVSSLRHDNYGHSIGFDAVSLDDIDHDGDYDEHKNTEGSETGNEEKSPAADDENDTHGDEGDKTGDVNVPDSEEKILGYKRKTKTAGKELPDTSAKSFLD